MSHGTEPVGLMFKKRNTSTYLITTVNKAERGGAIMSFVEHPLQQVSPTNDDNTLPHQVTVEERGASS